MLNMERVVSTVFLLVGLTALSSRVVYGSPVRSNFAAEELFSQDSHLEDVDKSEQNDFMVWRVKRELADQDASGLLPESSSLTTPFNSPVSDSDDKNQDTTVSSVSMSAAGVIPEKIPTTTPIKVSKEPTEMNSPVKDATSLDRKIWPSPDTNHTETSSSTVNSPVKLDGGLSKSGAKNDTTPVSVSKTTGAAQSVATSPQLNPDLIDPIKDTKSSPGVNLSVNTTTATVSPSASDVPATEVMPIPEPRLEEITKETSIGKVNESSTIGSPVTQPTTQSITSNADTVDDLNVGILSANASESDKLNTTTATEIGLAPPAPPSMPPETLNKTEETVKLEPKDLEMTGNTSTSETVTDINVTSKTENMTTTISMPIIIDEGGLNATLETTLPPRRNETDVPVIVATNETGGEVSNKTNVNITETVTSLDDFVGVLNETTTTEMVTTGFANITTSSDMNITTTTNVTAELSPNFTSILNTTENVTAATTTWLVNTSTGINTTTEVTTNMTENVTASVVTMTTNVTNTTEPTMLSTNATMATPVPVNVTMEITPTTTESPNTTVETVKGIPSTMPTTLQEITVIISKETSTVPTTPPPVTTNSSAAVAPSQGLSASALTAIITGSIIGFWIILGPIICLICKIRDKRKERYHMRLTNQSDPPADNGMLDAMIISELKKTSESSHDNGTTGKEKEYNTQANDKAETERLRSNTAEHEF